MDGWKTMIANPATIEELARYAKAVVHRAERVGPGVQFSAIDFISNKFLPENVWIMLPVMKPGESYLDWFMRGAIMIEGEVMKLDEIRQTEGLVVQKIGDEAQVKICFDDATGDRLKEIQKAEKHLRAAGLEFETGFHLAGEHKDRRVWQFDGSLSGASVVYKGPARADRIMVVTVEYGANEEQEK